MDKPAWLNKKVNLAACRRLKGLLREHSLTTVCEEALCPNISECFGQGVATFMILGDTCTRRCRFCGVKKGRPLAPSDSEPQRVAKAVERLGLKYIVLTSPSRDDLADGGAGHFARVVKAIKDTGPDKKVEILVPDFLGQPEAWERVAVCGAEVVAHNLETVPSLYQEVRGQASYRRSLSLLKTVKQLNPRLFTRSGLMLGLGEGRQEVLRVLRDLRKASCDFITLGQYLVPSLCHYPVKKYLALEEFDFFREQACRLGFKEVKSSPYVRSSYLAHTALIG